MPAVKVAVRKDAPKKKTNLAQPSKKKFLPLIIAALSAAFSFLPNLECCAIWIIFVMYAALFIWIFFTEKLTRKTDRIIQERGALLTMFLLSIAVPLTGGILSPLKWAFVVMVFVLCSRRIYLMAVYMLAILFFSTVRNIGAYAASDYYMLAVLATYIFVSFVNKRENSGIREKILSQTPPDSALSGVTSQEQFGRIANAAVKRLLDSYAVILKADSMVFFLKNQYDENYFDMAAHYTLHENHFNGNFRIKLDETVLGTAMGKGAYFEFSPEGTMPYYLSQSLKTEKAAIAPVVLNRVIGAVVCDFSEYKLQDETLRKAVTEIACELAALFELFEMNQRLVFREKRVSTLYDIYAKLNLMEGKQGLMKRLFDELATFDIASAYMAEYQKDENEMKISYVYNYPEKILGRVIKVKDEALINYVISNLRTSVTSGVSGRILSINYGKNSMEHFAILPVAVAGEILGIIKLDRETGEKFSEFEIKTFEMIVSRVAMLLENAKLYEKIQRQATRDGLTGLMNHITFQEKLQEAIEACDSGRIKCVSLFLTDIDFFKKFNDSFGHQEGDRVLKKTAVMLSNFEKKYPGTFAARYGGEEFVFVAPGYDLDAATKIAESIRRFSAENLKGGNETELRPINLSIGVSSYPQKASSGRDMIKTADEALYRAKKEGRNRVITA